MSKFSSCAFSSSVLYLYHQVEEVTTMSRKPIIVTAYNLRDVSYSQAAAKGEVFFQIWREFNARERIERIRAKLEAAGCPAA
jgi:hypothetical protein